MRLNREAIHDYAADKQWFWYVPAWSLIGITSLQLLRYGPNESGGLLIAPMSLLFFGLHELAHAFASGFPDIIAAAAGSLSEILFGVLLVAAAWKVRSYYAALYCVTWLAFACKDAGVYMADSRSQDLILFSPFGDNAVHDWHFVFTRLGILPYDKVIGGVLVGFSYVLCAFALGGGCWLMYVMNTTQTADAKTQRLARMAERLRSSFGYDQPGTDAPRLQANAVPDASAPKARQLHTAAVLPTQPSTPIYPQAVRGRLAPETDGSDLPDDTVKREQHA